MGKWATYQKRGGSNIFGSLAPPANPGVDWTAVTGGVGVITVTRFVGLPAGATNMIFRALDTTTNVFANPGNTTLTGLISGRVYKVYPFWSGAAAFMSDFGAPITVAAG